MSGKGKLLKRLNQKLSNNKILLLRRHAIISTDILLNFGPICCKLIDLTINNMIDFFLALGYKLLED